MAVEESVEDRRGDGGVVDTFGVVDDDGVCCLIIGDAAESAVLTIVHGLRYYCTVVLQCGAYVRGFALLLIRTAKASEPTLWLSQRRFYLTPAPPRPYFALQATVF